MMFWFGPRLVAQAACGDFVSVDKYLKAGDDVNERNQKGCSALHVAAEYNQIGVINTLLRCKDIDVNLQDFNGLTALMKAAKKGHSTIVDTLCSKCSDIDVNIPDNKGRTALVHARGNVSIVKILIKVPHVNVRLTGRSNCNAFQHACHRGQTKVKRAMIHSKMTSQQQLTREDLKYAIYTSKSNFNIAISRIV